MKHLIFFDSTCHLCRKAIAQIQKRDAQKQFAFYPLNSEKARDTLVKNLREEDTLILLEGGKRVWIRSKAVFRILKLLGGRYAWMGGLAHLPGMDFLYRIIAHNRHLFR